MKTKLQAALDDISMADALRLTEEIRGQIDIVEIGTPFLMEYGMAAVRTFRERFPELEILCDSKIMDAGGYEAKLACEAGADYVTVLAAADDATIAEVAAAAGKYGKKTVADMICVSDLRARVREAEALGADVIAVHTGVDRQAQGVTPLDDLRVIRECVGNASVAVAGGISEKTVAQYLVYRPEIIIVGGGILHAKDPAAAAAALAGALGGGKR